MTTNVPTTESPLAQEIAAFCTRSQPAAPASRADFPSSALWSKATATGTELWLDTGDLEAARSLWTREMRALTTNNTLLNKEVQKGIYDELVPDVASVVRKAADRELTEPELVMEIAFILNALHGLKLVNAFDADVSVELHTDLAHDTEASVRYGQRLAAVCPDRFIVKVPLTLAGLLAARQLGQQGIRVNFTLGFSARQNLLIARVAHPTFVNVFLGRLNAFVADNELGTGANVGEKATLASQRVLRELDIGVRQIGASIRNGQQCLDLLGLDVFTMPIAAAQQLIDSAPPDDQLVDRTDDDPAVEFAPGVDPTATGLDAFWAVTETFKHAVDRIMALDLDHATASDLGATLAGHGAGDLFPVFTAEEQEKVAAESKIPVAASWQQRVTAGTASWDGLLTAAALASFARDQQALDRRIKSLL